MTWYLGEWKFPPSLYCRINALCFYHRLLRMPENKVAKSVFRSLCNLNDQGFTTWVTRLCELASDYGIHFPNAAHLDAKQFKSGCVNIVKQKFIDKWHDNVHNSQSLRMQTYASFKSAFSCEKYLDTISVPKYRIALTRLRTSSHNLEIERGRYVSPRLIPALRLCTLCQEIDDEIHFVTTCRINSVEREYISN